MTIVAPVDGELADPLWAQLVTAALNDQVDNIAAAEAAILALANDVSALQDSSARLGCSLRRVANQTLSDASELSVSWDTEDQDIGGFWAAGTPTVVTVPETGVYAVMATIAPAAASTGTRGFVQFVFSAWGVGVKSFFGAGENSYSASTTVPLAAGATFTTRIFWDGAAASTFTAFLTCYRVADG